MSEVLLTGATGAIGLATAQALGQAGFTVHMAGRSQAKLKAAADTVPNARVLPPTDLSQPKAAADLVDALHQPHGLVCMAADLGATGPFASHELDAFQASFNLNLFAPAAMIQRFIQRGGKHVVVMSGAGLGGRRAFANVSSYSTAKAALVHLVEALAAENPDMSFNAVAPGPVVSQLTEQALAIPGEYGADAAKQKTSGGVSPALAANMIVWLMRQTTTPFVSGRLLAARFDYDLLGQSLDENRFRMRRIDGNLFK